MRLHGTVLCLPAWSFEVERQEPPVVRLDRATLAALALRFDVMVRHHGTVSGPDVCTLHIASGFGQR